jgi:soluble lytic murein transglycosylase-like protein
MTRSFHLRRIAPIATTACLLALFPAAVGATQAGPGPTSESARIDILIAEAARRFGVPEGWIRAVMRQESGLNPGATSHAGAMGLMQVMPATYAELRRRHGLGPDPYEPRDNVMAGAAYLREMHDRFGPIGMLAAYNAGPARYLQHRDEGRPLPAETRDYVTRLGPIIRPSGSTDAPDVVTQAPDPARAPLFPGQLPTAEATSSSLFPNSLPSPTGGGGPDEGAPE